MDALDRMFATLVHALRTKFPELLGNPFEVAELYQTIIPYRLHRRELGVESNEDYELTLMALLSGARGYLVGEGRMQEALRAALAAPQPDTTLFRSFATSRVAVATDALRRFDQSGESGAEEQPPLGSESSRSVSASRFADEAPSSSRAQPPARGNTELPPAYSHPLGRPLYGSQGSGQGSSRAASNENRAASEPERLREPTRGIEHGHDSSVESFRAPAEPAPEPRTTGRANSSDSRRDSGQNVARESARESFREPAREPMREPPVARRSGRTASSPSARPPLASPPPSPSPSAHSHSPMTTPSRSTTASALGGNCRYCGGQLPDGRRLVFCPHCGQNLTIQHCPACSTELELGWKYCTTCGRSVASA